MITWGGGVGEWKNLVDKYSTYSMWPFVNKMELWELLVDTTHWYTTHTISTRFPVIKLLQWLKKHGTMSKVDGLHTDTVMQDKNHTNHHFLILYFIYIHRIFCTVWSRAASFCNLLNMEAMSVLSPIDSSWMMRPLYFPSLGRYVSRTKHPD